MRFIDILLIVTILVFVGAVGGVMSSAIVLRKVHIDCDRHTHSADFLLRTMREKIEKTIP